MGMEIKHGLGNGVGHFYLLLFIALVPSSGESGSSKGSLLCCFGSKKRYAKCFQLLSYKLGLRNKSRSKAQHVICI